jgi:hypothetical protein
LVYSAEATSRFNAGPEPGSDATAYREGPETIPDLGAGVPTGTFTVSPGCAGLLIGFADRLLDEEIAG